MTESRSPVNIVEELRELAEEIRQEYERAQRELKEIDVLIHQSAREVDKYVQRNTQVTQQLRQVEANLESYPREEIKAVYTAAQDAQMRLLMMRNQLEQLQGKQENLVHFCQQARRSLDLIGQLSSAITELPGKTARGDDLPRDTVICLIEAQEDERQRLARQIHDGPAQALTNLILQAEICERLFATDPAQAQTELANLKKAVSATFQKTRDFIVMLRPMMLDDLGLLPTLRRYVESFEARSGIAATVTANGADQRYAPHTEITVYRVIQEALRNVEEHAHATRVRVSLDLAENQITAMVEDDGSGFDVASTLAQARQRKALGLASLQERVEMLGGSLQVESSTGRGTRVHLTLPAS